MITYILRPSFSCKSFKTHETKRLQMWHQTLYVNVQCQYIYIKNKTFITHLLTRYLFTIFDIYIYNMYIIYIYNIYIYIYIYIYRCIDR